MRAETLKQAMWFCVIVTAIACVAANAASSTSRPRSAPRSTVRTQSQQSQTRSFQTGQPDMAQRMAEQHMQQMQEMQRNMEQMQRQAEENKNRAIQQAVRASDEQWRRIKPKLERIVQLKADAEVSISPAAGNGNFQMQTFNSGDGVSGMMFGGMSSGGFAGPGGTGAPVDILDANTPSGSLNPNPASTGTVWTSSPRSVMEMSEGEAICQDLQRLLQDQSGPSAQISQKVAALRWVRMQARDNLAKARQELRTLITPDQEPALILMGYLD